MNDAEAGRREAPPGGDPRRQPREPVLARDPYRPDAVANGYEVEIAAPIAEGAAGVSMTGRWSSAATGRVASFAAAHIADGVRRTAAPASLTPGAKRPVPTALRCVRLGYVRRPTCGGTGRLWFLWPHTVRGWWHTLERELEPADLYHACGVLPIPAALPLAAGTGGRAGDRG